MGKSPFANMDKTPDLGFSRTSFMVPCDVVYDPTGAKNSDGSTRIISSRPATYFLQIDDVEMFEPRKGADLFKPSFTVLQGDGPSRGKACYMLATDSEYFDRDCARFVSNGCNLSPAMFKPSDYEMIVSKAQPMRGKVIGCVVDNVKTKAGNDFTRHDWFPVDVVRDAAGQIVSLTRAAVDNVALYLDALKHAAT